MIERQFLRIDDFLTIDERNLIDIELEQLTPSLKQEEIKDTSNGIMANFSRVHLLDHYRGRKHESDIIKIFSTMLFAESTLNRMGHNELLLNLIPHSTKTEIQYTIYEKGGQFEWHIDSILPTYRIANFIYYLNDDFEGGELELSYKGDTEVDVIITPKKNTLVIIPSDMWHRVRPVIDGHRKTINGHFGF